MAFWANREFPPPYFIHISINLTIGSCEFEKLKTNIFLIQIETSLRYKHTSLD